MLLRELKEMVESTADAAFAVDGAGLIVAWNAGAAALFGLSTAEALGQRCGQVLQGVDECGPVCSPLCSMRQASQNQHPINNFDMQVPTPQGPLWCNVSTLRAQIANSTVPKGTTTNAIASQLHISRTIVNNHIQRLLHKLNAHSQLEATRRAEHAGLI